MQRSKGFERFVQTQTRRRFAVALFVSLLFHALLLTLDGAGPEGGWALPGLTLPWLDRRVEAPPVQLRLVGQAPALAAPTGTSAGPTLRAAAGPAERGRRPTVAPTSTAAQDALPLDALPPPQPPALPTAEPESAPSAEVGTVAVEDASAQTMGEPEPDLIAVERADALEPDLVVKPTSPAPVAAVPALAASAAASSPDPGMPPRTAQAEVDAAALARAEAAAAEVARLEAARAEEARAQVARDEAARLEADRLAQARLDAEREAAARAEVARQQAAARAEADRQQAARDEAARQVLARQAAARAEEARLTAERAEREMAAREMATREAAMREEQARREAARAEAARLAAQREAAAQAQRAQQAAARAEEALRAAERESAARESAARESAAREDAAREAAARESAAREQQARLAAARAEADRLAAEREGAARARAAAVEADNERREAARRAMGRQLDEEAARRDAAAAATRPPNELPYSWSSARRGRIFGRTDANLELALYAEAWARRVHLNLSVEAFREAAAKAQRQPMVTVAVRSDGSVESVSLVVPSGSPELDELIRRSVMSLAPFPAFAPALARDYDVIEIRRSWVFDSAVRLH